jgi:hypothetical protein
MLVRRGLVWCASTRHAVGTHVLMFPDAEIGANAPKIKHKRDRFVLARILLKEG